jgi:hypothetical protein
MLWGLYISENLPSLLVTKLLAPSSQNGKPLKCQQHSSEQQTLTCPILYQNTTPTCAVKAAEDSSYFSHVSVILGMASATLIKWVNICN